MYFPISLTLISITSVTLRREAIHKLTADRSQWYTQYDYIVVGAGAAGCVVANRLSADHKHTVLLLEAGGPQNVILNDLPKLAYLYLIPLFPLPNGWNYYNVPQKNAGHFYPGGRIMEQKGKVLGGSASFNGMVYLRGNKRDFNQLVDKYGAKGWSYREVLPLFMKSENNSDQNIVRQNPGYHGTEGPIGVSSASNPPKILLKYLKAFNELGFKTIDFNGPQMVGTNIAQSNIKDGWRSNSASAYIDPNPNPNTLHILTKAFVTKILFRKSMNKLIAFGVEFNKDNHLYRVVANKEVILSAGPINSPQILMLSGIGPKDHLNSVGIEVKADLPVGNNYANHISNLIVGIVKDNEIPNVTQFPVLLTHTNTKNNADKSWPNIQIQGIPVILPGLQLFFIPIILVRPRSRGTLRLQSANPYEPPLIDPQFLTHPKDFEDLVEATKFTYFVLKNTSFAKYIAFEKISKFFGTGCPDCTGKPFYLCDQYIRCKINRFGLSYYHPVGTCRMGSVRRSDVVVDERLRVKNVFNLRVCDSSIYPEIISANTQTVSYMAGEKCAIMVREDDH